MNILSIKNLTIWYDKKEVIKNINLDIKEHSIVCFMGNSGCGKSSFFSALNGFLEENGGAYSGNIFFKDENIKNIKPLDLKRKIAILFQDSKPFPFSVLKNILYPLEFYSGKKDTQLQTVKELLQWVNLYDEVKSNLNMSAEKLSGGQQQRLCIARMLAAEPEILIFDEPSSSLDIKNTLIIEELIKNLSKKYTILIATHNMEQAQRLTDTIIKMDEE